MLVSVTYVSLRAELDLLVIGIELFSRLSILGECKRVKEQAFPTPFFIFGPVWDGTLKSSFSGAASYSCPYWFETQFLHSSSY